MWLVASCAVLAGCGSGGAGPPPRASVLFAEACGACHSLSGRNSPLLQGGDLLAYRFGREVMLEFAREMPVHRPLDARELSAVVDYVIGVERRAHPLGGAPGRAH